MNSDSSLHRRGAGDLPRATQPIKHKALHPKAGGHARGWRVQPWSATEDLPGATGLRPLLPLLMAEFAMTVASLHWSALETE